MHNRKNFECYVTDTSLTKDWIFPYSEVVKDSGIVLYGAGDVGQAYYAQIIATGYCQVLCWVDQNYKLYQKYGLPVVSVDEIKRFSEANSIVIAVSSHIKANEINSQLLKKGIDQEKIIWIGDVRYTFRQDPIMRRLIKPLEFRWKEIRRRRGIDSDDQIANKRIETWMDDLNSGHMIIPRLVLQVPNACTMRCRDCNNLIPMHKTVVHENVNNVIEDVEKVISKVKKIITLEIIGGEPFLYPDLCKTVEYLLTQKKIVEIEITT